MAKEFGPWSEQTSSAGRKYFYNKETEVSQWEKPAEWRDHELQLEHERMNHRPPPPPLMYPPPFPFAPPGFPGFVPPPFPPPFPGPPNQFGPIPLMPPPPQPNRMNAPGPPRPPGYPQTSQMSHHHPHHMHPLSHPPPLPLNFKPPFKHPPHEIPKLHPYSGPVIQGQPVTLQPCQSQELKDTEEAKGLKRELEDPEDKPVAKKPKDEDDDEEERPWLRFYSGDLAQQKREELKLIVDNEMGDLAMQGLELENKLIEELIKVKQAAALVAVQAHEVLLCEGKIANLKEQQNRIEGLQTFNLPSN